MKSDKYYTKIKLFRNPMLEISDVYEFKITLLDNGDPE